MRRNIVIILSAVLVITGVVFTLRYLTQGQSDPQLSVLTLNEINNTESFLWTDEKVGETVFYLSGIQMEPIPSNPNPYFELRFNVKDMENNSLNTQSDGFTFSANKGNFTHNKLKVFYDELNGNNEIEVRLQVNPKVVNEGNYRIGVDLMSGEFDFSELNNDIPLDLILPINSSLPTLAKVLYVFLVGLLLMLIVWFLLLKKQFFPSFSLGGSLEIGEETIHLKKEARKFIFGNKIKEEENWFSKVFYGPIQRVYPESEHSFLITPRENPLNKQLKYYIRERDTTSISSRSLESFMCNDVEYKVITGNEELVINYLNLKHEHYET